MYGTKSERRSVQSRIVKDFEELVERRETWRKSSASITRTGTGVLEVGLDIYPEILLYLLLMVNFRGMRTSSVHSLITSGFFFVQQI